MKAPTYQANGDGATRRDLIVRAAGGMILASVSSAGGGAMPTSPLTSVDRLLAIEDIKYRKARYAYCVDHKDWEGFGANFTEDAVWDISEAMNPRDPVTGQWTGVSELSEEFLRSYADQGGEWPVIGRDNIMMTVKRGLAQKKQTSAHKLFTPMIEILSDTYARAIWPFEDESYSPPPRPFKYLNGVGYYHETYSKVGDEWLIKSTNVKRTFLVLR